MERKSGFQRYHKRSNDSKLTRNLKRVVIFIILTVFKPKLFAKFQQEDQVQRCERVWGERMKKGIAPRDTTRKTEWRLTEMLFF